MSSVLYYRLTFLSINRFERKKNIELAISAFAMLYNSQHEFVQDDKRRELSLVVAGKFHLLSAARLSQRCNR